MSSTFNPKEYLDFANDLLQSEDKRETCFRTIVSRSYYAAFLYAENIINKNDMSLLPNLEKTSDDKSVHWRVREGLKEIPGKGSQKVLYYASDLLYALFKKRIDADYKIGMMVGVVEAMSALQ